MSPFGLFKKKPSGIGSADHSIPTPTTDTLSIQQAQDLLQNLESAKVKELSASLAQIQESAVESLKGIDSLQKMKITPANIAIKKMLNPTKPG